MSDTLQGIKRKIGGAEKLESVVRTMKVLAASNIGQYEKALAGLDGYCQTVEMGLAVYFRSRMSGDEKKGRAQELSRAPEKELEKQPLRADAVVFGSDQGLVGRFNDAVAGFALSSLKAAGADIASVWAVGERVFDRLDDAGVRPASLFEVPCSVHAISQLVSRILIECGPRGEERAEKALYAFYNRQPRSAGAANEPACARLLPLDDEWRLSLANKDWPTKKSPEIISPDRFTLLSLVREHLFASLFRACAESLAAENACRLAAMQRAEKNIGELLETLGRSFHRLRQDSIDEELFDVVSGFEAMNE